jgi:hypothetical protein
MRNDTARMVKTGRWCDSSYTCMICHNTFLTSQREMGHYRTWETCAVCLPKAIKIETIKDKRRVDERSKFQDYGQ